MQDLVANPIVERYIDCPSVTRIMATWVVKGMGTKHFREKLKMDI